MSDIHGNVDALEAVMADIEKWDVRGIFCLGDIVGYGPEPAACVETVMGKCAATVLGNHEAMLFAIEKVPDLNWRKAISAPLELALGQLSADQKAWLRGLPLVAEMDPMIFSHGSVNEPTQFDYVHSDDEAIAHFAAQELPIHFQGHTHVPVIWKCEDSEPLCYEPPGTPIRLEDGPRYSVNVGSVGQPRDGDWRSSYALYDPEMRILLHRRVEYDIARARKRFRKAGLPKQNADRLTIGE